MASWKPGQSGNLNGRGRAVQALTIIARKECRKAIALCVSVLSDAQEKTTTRLVAAGMLLDRGLGKPAQQVSVAQLSDEELLSELMARRELRAKEEAARAEQRRAGGGASAEQ